MKKIKGNLKTLREQIKICYDQSFGLILWFLILMPLMITLISFIYTLLGQSQQTFTLWQNIYLSVFDGYRAAFICFAIGIPFQLMAYSFNMKVRVNGVNTADPENAIAIVMFFRLFGYCIVFCFLYFIFRFLLFFKRQSYSKRYRN